VGRKLLILARIDLQNEFDEVAHPEFNSGTFT
jgi:hypothetical protein